MAVVYKNINDYTQKQSVAGTEKIPVSDTEFITPSQIASLGGSVSDVTLGGTSVVSGGTAVLPAYPTTLPASDVSSWAKQSTKPSYTASEVGALPDTTVIPTVPTNVSAFTNDANYVKYVLCADEAAYNAISTKDSGTLYLIPKSS